MSWAPSPPAWYPDPGRAHEWRYFNGSNWTDDVSDSGVVTQAPLGAVPPGQFTWTAPQYMVPNAIAAPPLVKVPRGLMWTLAVLSTGVFWSRSPEHTTVVPFGAIFAIACWIITSKPLAAHRAAGSPAAREITAARWIAVGLTLLGFLQATAWAR